MKQLSIREARQGLAHLDELLASEGEIVITRRGRPIARVCPVEPMRPLPSLKAFRARQPLQSVPSEVLLQEERERDI